ncbi:MAG TPA: DUF1778 domain-containing protein [Solirubrobacterales bacterium]|nr:DUF1778 domain-containing protein [Solirubrobacterales bacterium]
MASRPRETKDLRWNLRVEGSEDALVRTASEALDTSYSNFIRSAAVSEAQRVLADRNRFFLSPPQWEEFERLLERPPRIPDGVSRLYSQPSVFE